MKTKEDQNTSRKALFETQRQVSRSGGTQVKFKPCPQVKSRSRDLFKVSKSAKVTKRKSRILVPPLQQCNFFTVTGDINSLPITYTPTSMKKLSAQLQIV